MKKYLKIMMFALVSMMMVVGFSACSSDDDDDPVIFQKGVVRNETTGSSLEVWGKIEAAYNAKLGGDQYIQGKSESEVRTLALEAEKSLANLDWGNATGTITYEIENITTKKVIYSHTFSSK